MLLGWLACCAPRALAQYDLRGVVVSQATEAPLPDAAVFLAGPGLETITCEEGRFVFTELPEGAYRLHARAPGFPDWQQEIELRSDTTLRVAVVSYSTKEVEVRDKAAENFGKTSLRDLDGAGIYAAKKTEVIELDQLTANLAANNPRQVYARVPGLNIWESDGAGLQLGIGARGLSPQRASNFNTRQNGYDISADALGYPESYYTPPAEALERIEIVRGAASLQYGTQFGGMLNFVFKEGPKDKKIEARFRQTAGSFGFFNTFNSIGGTLGDVNYYGFYQFKRADGWRENAGFEQHTAFGSAKWQVAQRLTLKFEYTHMRYLAQQPGGLTDRMFETDPRRSIRERNWFRVNWNLGALVADYKLGPKTRLNSRTFALAAEREALGNLERINVADFGEERTLIRGQYRNIGNETRLIQQWNALGMPATFLAGVRYYRGYTRNRQGLAGAGSGPDFRYLNPEEPENSDYDFPSRNLALFAEQVVYVSPKLSLTPGVRFEHIGTFSDGYYRRQARDFAGNIIVDEKLEESLSRERQLLLFGLGAEYKPGKTTEIYANFSQNYRAVTFSDLRVVNPNFEIDPDIQDERGYNIDLGARGQAGDWLNYDASLFYLRYRDRIGLLFKDDQPPLFLPYRYRTNVADSRTYGFEGFAEAKVLKFLKVESKTEIRLFANVSLLDGRYVASDAPSINGRQVELVPPFMLRCGASLRRGGFSSTLQYSRTARHYTDATNAEFAATAVNGVIPAYQVLDLSARYEWKRFKFEASVNNLANQMYFTRRAAGYPGPGILPADGRAFFLTTEITL